MKFNRGVLRQCLSRWFLCLLRVDPLALYPALLWSSSDICLEVVCTDDRTLLGRSFEGLGQVLRANYQSCWAVGGSGNNVKLKAYRVEYHAAGLRFVEGRWDSFLGPVPLEGGNLVMAGVPLVMGESPSEKLCKLEARLRAARSRMLRLRPFYLLCLRVVHVYALSVMNFIFEAMPPHEDLLRKAQVLLHPVLLACIGISWFVPLAPLYGVTASLGFCARLLLVRSRLRYVKGLFVALNSRSVYTRCMLRDTVLGARLRQFAGSNWECVCKWLPSFQLHFRLVGHPNLCPAGAPLELVVRRPPRGPVLVITGSSKQGDRHG